MGSERAATVRDDWNDPRTEAGWRLVAVFDGDGCYLIEEDESGEVVHPIEGDWWPFNEPKAGENDFRKLGIDVEHA